MVLWHAPHSVVVGICPVPNVRAITPSWQVEQTPGGFKVLDANGQALVYARETREQASIDKALLR